MFCWTLHLSEDPGTFGYAAVAVEHEVYSFGGVCHGDTNHICVNVFNTVTLRRVKLSPMTPGRGERHLEAPSRRKGHTAVLMDDIVYIWGGSMHSGSSYCNMLYAFDVDAHGWSKPRVSGTIPEGREGHSACVLGRVMYIHGGCTQTSLGTGDMYKLDTSTMVWTLINTGGTPPAAWHSATIIGTKMFLFGGFRVQDNILRVFDTETNLWLTMTSGQLHPGGRFGHSAFTYNGELYVFGGWMDKNLSDLWKYSPETFSWKEVELKGKGPSSVYGMCCCVVGNRIVLSRCGSTHDDLYMLDLSPSLKMLCKLAVLQYGVDQTELQHNIRWELAAMTSCTK